VNTTKTHYLLFLFFCFSCGTKPSIEERKEYYDNGSLKSIKRYKDNVLNGQAQWFYPDGTIEQNVMFHNGVENGNAHYFYRSGALKNHRHWRNGKMNGYVADYHDDTVGIIKAVLIYNNDGALIYKKSFDKLGRLISEEGKKPDAP